MLQDLANFGKTLQNQPIIFVGGKGGVGKTTVSAGLACYFASLGRKTRVISTDPAHSLGDALDQALDHQPKAVGKYLTALELNPDWVVERHFQQVERTIKSYANPEMLPKIQSYLKISKSAPGAVEAAMLEAMCQQLVDAQNAGYQHVIFDTAPTGHTLRLLVLPEMMSAWTDGLLAQQRRQAQLKSVANRLGAKSNSQNFRNPFTPHTPDKWAQAVEVLEKRKRLFQQAGALLHDTSKTAIILVMIADNLPLFETRRAVDQLLEANLTPTAIIVNQLIKPDQSDVFWQKRHARQQSLLTQIEQDFATYPIYPIGLQQTDIRGFEALSQLFLTNRF